MGTTSVAPRRRSVTVVGLLAGLVVSGLSAVAGSGPASATPAGSAQLTRSTAVSSFGVAVAGDSYSAGNGAGSYVAPTACYRSTLNYAARFVAAVNKAPYGAHATLTDVACSGAVTADVIGTGPQQRPSQVSQIPTATKLVFLTIGGNDGHFADIVQNCLIVGLQNGTACDHWLTTAQTLVSGGTRSTYAHLLTSVLTKVHARAPGAKIVVVGYPYLLATSAYTIGMRSGKATTTVKVGRRLYAIQDAADSDAAATVGTASSSVFVSTHALFKGHGIDPTKQTSSSWLVWPSTAAAPATWFHPTPTGWAQEAALLVTRAKDYGVPTTPGVGTAFAAAKAPLPADAGTQPRVQLVSDACPTAGSCVAVGGYADGLGYEHELVETLSAGAWTALKAPPPVDVGTDVFQFAILGSVACPAAGSCIAVGNYSTDVDRYQGLVATLSGGVWTEVQAPLPANANMFQDASLAAVACTAVGSCMAVGSYLDDNGYRQGLIETLSGGVWTASEMPLPITTGTDQFVDLESVACSAPGWCAVVGSYNDRKENQQGLLALLSGHKWAGLTAPLPADAFSEPWASMTSVVCPATGSCVAVGTYGDNTAHSESAVETLSGGHWSVVEAPQLSDDNAGDGVGLSSVACTTARACIAVGQYLSVNNEWSGLVERLADGTWTGAEAPVPANATLTDTALWSVTCTSTASCIAVGQYADSSGNQQGLIETQGRWSH